MPESPNPPKPAALADAEDEFLNVVTRVARMREAIDSLPERHKASRLALEESYDAQVAEMHEALERLEVARAAHRGTSYRKRQAHPSPTRERVRDADGPYASATHPAARGGFAYNSEPAPKK